MTNRTLAKIIVSSAGLLFCLGALEISVRLALHCDAAGNCRFRSTPLKPYRVDIQKIIGIIDRYRTSSDSNLLYDGELGWRLRPGVHNHNSAGFITTGASPDPARPADRLRIAVFGGSYTEGTFEHGWWRVLESKLSQLGVPCEVLNFGVSGYAMDQAYLRWKRDGVKYHPHLVLFGFSAGNSLGNVNLMPMLENPESSIPFTKPRYILENGGIRLINSPTPPPEQIPGIMSNLPTWPPITHEFFYSKSDFEMKPWRLSKLTALLEAKMGNPRSLHTPIFYQLQDEPARVSLGIVRQFAKDVESAGCTFWIAHIPHHIELDDLRSQGRFRFQELLGKIDAIAPTIHTERALLDACQSGPIESFFVDGHYNDSLQTAVGETIARYIAERRSELPTRPIPIQDGNSVQ